MVQAPSATNVAVLPETVQTAGVVDANVTCRPEEALAFRASVPAVIDCELMGPNMIVWLAPVLTLTLASAGAYVPLPACVAVMVQVPAITGVTVFPETVHTDGIADVRTTGSPADDVAPRVNGEFTGCAGSDPNVIVCVCPPPPLTYIT